MYYVLNIIRIIHNTRIQLTARMDNTHTSVTCRVPAVSPIHPARTHHILRGPSLCGPSLCRTASVVEK